MEVTKRHFVGVLILRFGLHSTIQSIYVLYRVAHKKRPELSHGIMQQRNQNESTE